MASESSSCRWLGRWRRVNTTTWLLASGREPQQPLDSRATGSGAGITEIPNQASWLRSRDRTGSELAVLCSYHYTVRVRVIGPQDLGTTGGVA